MNSEQTEKDSKKAETYDSPPPVDMPKRGKWLRRLFRGSLFLFCLLILLGLSVYFLPNAVSTEWFRGRLEGQCREWTKRTVLIRSLNCSWADGLIIEGLTLSDDPAFSNDPLLHLDRLHLQWDPAGMLSRRLVFELQLRGLDARFIRDRESRTNLEKFFEQFQGEAAPAGPSAGEKGDGRPAWLIPLEVQGRIQLEGLSVLAQDLAQNRRMEISEGRMMLDVPSLRDAPVSLTLDMKAALNDKPLPPVSASVRVEDLVDARGLLDVRGALLEMSGRIPGVTATAKGGLGTSEITGQVKLDFGTLVDLVRPIVGPRLPDITGRLDLNVRLSGDPAETIRYRATASLDHLRASEGFFGGKKLQVAHMGLTNKGRADLNRGVLVDEGNLAVNKNTRMAWRGRVESMKSSDPSVAVTLGGVHLDLNELYQIGKDFIPKETPVVFSGDAGPGGWVGARAIRVKGIFPKGTARISLEDVSVQVPEVHTMIPEGRVISSGFACRFEEGGIDLKSMFPTDVKLHMALGIGDLRIQGKRELTLKRLDIPHCVLNVRNFDRTAEGPWGFTGEVTVDHRTSLQSLAMPPVLHLTGLEQGLRAECRFGETPAVDLRVRSLSIKSPRVALENPSVGSVQTGIDLSFAPLRVRLNPSKQSEMGYTGSVVFREVLEVTSFKADGMASFPKLQQGLEGMCRLRDGSALDLDLKKLNVSVPELKIEGLAGGPVEVDLTVETGLEVRELIRSPKSLFGIQGRFSIAEKTVLRNLKVPDFGRVPLLTQTGDMTCHLKNESALTADIKKFSLSAPDVILQVSPKESVKTSLNAVTELSGLGLSGSGPMRIDLKQGRIRADTGRAIAVDITGAMENSGLGRLSTKGEMKLRLAELAALFRPWSPKGVDLSGGLELGWSFSGRVPGKREIDRMRRAETPLVERLQKDSAFYEQFSFQGTCRDMDIHWMTADGSPVRVRGVWTPEPVRISLIDGLKQGKLSGKLVLNQIDALPYAGPFHVPLKGSISFTGSQHDLQSVQFSQALQLKPVDLTQSITVTLNHVDKLIGLRKKEAVLPVLLEQTEGSLKGRFHLDSANGLSRYVKGFLLRGELDMGTEIDLSRGKAVKGSVRLRSPGLDVRLGDVLDLKGLRSNLFIEKQYAVGTAGAETDTRHAERSLLSEEMVNPPSGDGRLSASDDHLEKRIRKDLQGRLTSGPSLAFRSADIKAGTIPVKLANHELQMRLARGLPVIDFFRLDLLGGSMVGRFGLSPRRVGFGFESEAAFSGLDANKLLQGVVQGEAGEDAEMSGRITLMVPLRAEASRLLQDLQAGIHLTHIGSRTLERVLYAMDPYESNETIVEQRKLLRMGSPRWVKVDIQYGNLSLTGEVEAKGVRLALPRIERLTIADLPIRKKLEERLTGLKDLVDLLAMVSAERIGIDDQGTLRFLQEREQ